MGWPKLTATCGHCGKPRGLTHTCVTRTDIKARKRAAGAPVKRSRPAHDYMVGNDRECPRPLCAAFRTGHDIGYDEGFADGMAACRRPHGGAS